MPIMNTHFRFTLEIQLFLYEKIEFSRRETLICKETCLHLISFKSMNSAHYVGNTLSPLQVETNHA